LYRERKLLPTSPLSKEIGATNERVCCHLRFSLPLFVPAPDTTMRSCGIPNGTVVMANQGNLFVGLPSGSYVGRRILSVNFACSEYGLPLTSSQPSNLLSSAPRRLRTCRIGASDPETTLPPGKKNPSFALWHRPPSHCPAAAPNSGQSSGDLTRAAVHRRNAVSCRVRLL
jgi:hypothetical protein